MITTEEFIKKCIKVHGSKYDYSLTEYKGGHYKVKIICPTHGVFEQEAKSHINKNGCSKCKTKSIDLFIEQAKQTHGEIYDYTGVVYVNSYTKVKIVCPSHGEFNQVPYAHIRGQGCKKCHFSKRVLTQDVFLKRCKKFHGEKYDYSKSKYINSNTKVEIICPDHGSFQQLPDDHCRGIGCSKCKSSHGERKIRKFLESRNIKFDEQVKFETCVNVRKLPFDFYLYEYDVLIEYQGEQHFAPKSKNRMFGASNPIEEYNKIKINDEIKSKWCIDNNMKLIEISYKEDLNEKMEQIINSLH
jgi:hypothetical protein